MHRFIHLFASLLFMMLLTIGCSSNSSDPIAAIGSSSDIPENSITQPGHSLLGMYEMVLDPDTLTAETYQRRDLAGHINISGWMNPVIQIQSYNPLTQTYSINVTISNPFSLYGYDVRLIMFTNDQGLRLLNDEAWTDLYDVAGGKTRNPFVAYAKSVPNRKFEAYAQHMENLQIYFPNPSGPIQYAFDASFPTNCEEPYKIANFTHTPLLQDAGSTSDLSIEVFDWQNNISSVSISALPITGSFYSQFTYNSVSGKWETMITNSQGAAYGDYECLVVATSGGYSSYDYVTITIDETGCELDDNQNCTTATSIGLTDLISGCVDSVDPEDWFYLLLPPNGTTGGTVSLQILSGDCYMIVYSCDDAEICPGTMVNFATHVEIPASSNSRYYVRVFATGNEAVYRLTTNITPAITNIPCEIYVATTGAPYYTWPKWEAPNPDITLNTTILNSMLTWNNYFWNMYGYNLVWDGTVTTMSSQYYILNSSSESAQMHEAYGKGTGKVSLYFCDVLNDGVETAYCVPFTPKTLHNVNNTYTVYSPNVWYWQNVIAHEHGHAIGYLLDQYLFDWYDLPCGDTSGFPAGVPRYLYSDPLGCYTGNLMMGSVEGWSWDKYDLTAGQENFVNWFHLNYPTNFPKY